MPMPPDRETVLAHPDALDCTLYRPDERDADAEETDQGDARLLFTGAFQPPRDWDAQERADYFDGTPEDCFVTARIACEAAPGSASWFETEPGDYAAVVEGGKVAMFYVYDQLDSGDYVLIREDDLD